LVGKFKRESPRCSKFALRRAPRASAVRAINHFSAPEDASFFHHSKALAAGRAGPAGRVARDELKQKGKAMMKAVVNMTIGLGLMVLAAQQAAAQQQARNCAPRDAEIERLAEAYGETRQNIGLGSRGIVIETFASSATGTWTITATLPSGMTCLVASGQSFETLAEALPPTGNDA
jgi:hypothetical protein